MVDPCCITGYPRIPRGAVLSWGGDTSPDAIVDADSQQSNVAQIVNVLAFPGVTVGTVAVTLTRVGGQVTVWFFHEIDNTGGPDRLYTYRILRDGVEVNAADRIISEVPGGDRVAVNGHWADNPTVGSHTYDVQAISNSVAVTQVSNARRVSAIAT